MRHGSRFHISRLLFLTVLLTVPGDFTGLFAQSIEAGGHSQSDYPQEGSIYEYVSTKFRFDNDGTSVREQDTRVCILSDAGVQKFGVLSFAYESLTTNLEVEFVRVRKPDGTVVLTPADSYQNMPSEITRQAPVYSDLHETHVAVKGLSAGDLLEYHCRWKLTKPVTPGNFWVDYNFIADDIALQELLQISVPKERTIKVKSTKLEPEVSQDGNYRVYTWESSNRKRKPDDEQDHTWENVRGRQPQPDVRLSSFQSWDEVGHWYGDLQSFP